MGCQATCHAFPRSVCITPYARVSPRRLTVFKELARESESNLRVESDAGGRHQLR